ncbi:MAG TPA: trypsin-like peptidase domain-containing protein [Myxococcales bacterium]|nr:trypsin-like peptidase domain-containing protein [Myxococcales bacterium]
MRWALAAAALLWGAAAPPPPAKKPTNAALRKAFENNARSVVEVVGPHRSGAGVVVGARGHVLTSVDHVSLDEAVVKIDGQALRARVVMASAELKAAVVVVMEAGAPDGGTPDGGPGPAGPVFRAPAVRLDDTYREGTELVAIQRDDRGELQPCLAQISRGRKATSPFVEVNVPLPNGTPLFDGQGRLVAITVQRRKASSRALPVPEVKSQLSQAASP